MVKDTVGDAVEIWKPVPKHKNYEISNFGRVRRAPMILSGGMCKGYVYVTIRENAKYRRLAVHRIVGEVFIGSPTPEKSIINHKNSNRSDNRVENLEWVNKSENALHAIAAGKWNDTRAEKSSRTTLTWEKVNEMRSRRLAGESYAELAKLFGVSKTGVISICKNKRWVI